MGGDIDYEFVGRLIYQPNHWVARICVEEEVYDYDDMKHQGKLMPAGPSQRLEDDVEESRLMVFRRDSLGSVSYSATCLIAFDHQHLTPLAFPRSHDVPLELFRLITRELQTGPSSAPNSLMGLS